MSHNPDTGQDARPREDTIRQTGMVKQYLAGKGFGFISRQGDSDLFFHITTFETPEAPPGIGEHVSFEIVPSRRKPGTLAAANVRREPDPSR